MLYFGQMRDEEFSLHLSCMLWLCGGYLCLISPPKRTFGHLAPMGAIIKNTTGLSG
jgi:hypothetical protein